MKLRYDHCCFALIAGLFVVSCSAMTRPQMLLATEIVAHRGASFDAPENTRASVELGWQQGADAVEVDVYLSSDNKIVAIHDKTPKRYGGPDRAVASMSWEQLQTLDVGAWKDEKWRGEKIPLLADLIPLTPAGRRLFIEIKAGPEIVPHLKTVLNESKQPRSQLAIIAFSQQVVAAVREQLPEINCYWLASIRREPDGLSPSAEQVIATAHQLNVPGVDLGGELTGQLIKEVIAADLECYVWTINDPRRARELVSWGVIGVTTDKPGVMKKALQSQTP